MTARRPIVGLLAAIAVLAGFGGPVPAAVSALELQIVPERVRQGGIAMLRIRGATAAEPVRVRVGRREWIVEPAKTDGPRILWIGVDLEEPPGAKEIAVTAGGDGGSGKPPPAKGRLLVMSGGYPVQHLTVPRTFTELDTATLERVSREKAILDRLWEEKTAGRLWRGPFRVPLDGTARGSGFGLKRIINGEPRAPHTGVDFSAPAGAPVLAANTGAVALADDHFFAGYSLVLDHGEGLYTMYFHLQEVLVRPGQRVALGEAVGRVGSTGRATGPHLHWGARLLGARIDPEELLRLLPE